MTVDNDKNNGNSSNNKNRSDNSKKTILARFKRRVIVKG